MNQGKPINRGGRPRTIDRQRAAPVRTAEPRDAETPRAFDATQPTIDVAPRRSGEDTDQPLRRRSRAERQESRFGIPAHLKQPGWDYQYWPISVLGQPVSRSEMTDVYQGGWRPVPVNEMSEIMPPGDTSEFVEEGGQRLFKRPMSFTIEAKAEERALALEGTAERVKAASRGATSDGAMDIKGVRAVPLGMDMQAEAGTYNTPGR